MSSSARAAFTFRLVGVGWAEARFSIGDSWTAITASYIGDALDDLLAGVHLLTLGEPTSSASWAEEPGEYLWEFKQSGGLSTVRITMFADDSDSRAVDSPGTEVLNEEVELAELVRAVASGARAVLEELGADGYLERWMDFPFPTEDLLALEQWSASQRAS